MKCQIYDSDALLLGWPKALLGNSAKCRWGGRHSDILSQRGFFPSKDAMLI